MFVFLAPEVLTVDEGAQVRAAFTQMQEEQLSLQCVA